MNLLLFSNSTNAGEQYLSYTLAYISEFLENKQMDAVFIPYAGVTITWNDFSQMVAEKLVTTGINLLPIHTFPDPVKAVEQAKIIIVGGGNTFHLLKTLQDYKLITPIREKVLNGTPYIGWSAGSNVACPTICTTNDMPIVQPESFQAFNIIPFQINPHYTDAVLQNHAGETREMRIKEYLAVHRGITIAGLREGSLFEIKNNTVLLKGKNTCRIFCYGKAPFELSGNDDFSFLMQ